MHKIRFKIKDVLDSRNKTIYWLAKEAQLPYATIHKLTCNKTNRISFDVLDRICDALECEPGELMFREGIGEAG